MKLEELKGAIGEVLAEQIADLKQPAGRKKFIDEAGGPDEATGVLKAAQYYANVIGISAGDGSELKDITGSILWTGEPAQGGNLVAPEEVMREIVRIEKEASVVSRLCRTLNQTTQRLRVPTDTGDVTVTYVGESIAKSVTKPSFGKVDLDLKKAALLVVLTDEMISDSVVDIVNHINTKIGEEFGADLDTRVLGPADTTPFSNIDQNAGNTINLPSNGPDYNSAIDVTTSIARRAMRGARWFMHPTVLGEYRKVKGTDGHPIFQPPLAGAIGTICGYPVELVDTMPTWNDASATEMVALFGDLGRWYLGRNKALQMRVSDTASVTLDGSLVSAFENNLIIIRAEDRKSGALVLPAAFTRIRKAAE